MGAFRPGESDLDVAVVVSESAGGGRRQRPGGPCHQAGDRLLRRATRRCCSTPTRAPATTGTSSIWPIAREHGRALLGPPPSELIPPVSARGDPGGASTSRTAGTRPTSRTARTPAPTARAAGSSARPGAGCLSRLARRLSSSRTSGATSVPSSSMARSARSWGRSPDADLREEAVCARTARARTGSSPPPRRGRPPGATRAARARPRTAGRSIGGQPRSRPMRVITRAYRREVLVAARGLLSSAT